MLTADSVHAAAGAALTARFTGFVGFLRANGFRVGVAETADTLAVAGRVDLFDPLLLRWSLRALLCSRGDEWRRFDELFEAWFLPPNRRSLVESRGGGGVRRRDEGGGERSDGTPIATAPGESSAADGSTARHGASCDEALANADFRHLNAADDVRAIEALMQRLAERLRRLRLRRERQATSGRRLDLGRTIRRSIPRGGLLLDLAWWQRRRVRPRLVLLLDVSRSMSLYSFFYLRLARALAAALPDVHCFIFHTRLTGVSQALADPDPWRSQERLQLLSAGWAGGTRIGECLDSFNREHATLLGARTHVVIVSDGLDTGEPERLAAALATTRRRARSIVWLNPLAARPGFAPTSRGMQAALPHLDLLAPGADLASIERILPQLLAATR